jgi:hypothetical protein
VAAPQQAVRAWDSALAHVQSEQVYCPPTDVSTYPLHEDVPEPVRQARY